METPRLALAGWRDDRMDTQPVVRPCRGSSPATTTSARSRKGRDVGAALRRGSRLRDHCDRRRAPTMVLWLQRSRRRPEFVTPRRKRGRGALCRASPPVTEWISHDGDAQYDARRSRDASSSHADVESYRVQDRSRRSLVPQGERFVRTKVVKFCSIAGPRHGCGFGFITRCGAGRVASTSGVICVR